MAEIRPCGICGKQVTRRGKQAAARKVWYCSNSCAGKARMAKRIAEGERPQGRKPRTGDNINCSVCGKEFYRQPAYIKQGRHLCSRECNNAWQARNQITKTCPQCGKEFSVPQSYAANVHCSHRCEKASRIKRPTGRSHNGQSALINFQGYITVYEPNHPNANRSGRVLEHRLVMEEQIGRILESDEHVHHINHDKADNDPDNLEIVDPSAHGRETNEYTKERRLSIEEELAEYRRRFGPLEDLDS